MTRNQPLFTIEEISDISAMFLITASWNAPPRIRALAGTSGLCRDCSVSIAPIQRTPNSGAPARMWQSRTALSTYIFVSLMSPFTFSLSSFRYVNRSLNVLLAHLRGQLEHCTPCTLDVGLACTCIPSVFSNSLSTAAHLDYYLG